MIEPGALRALLNGELPLRRTRLRAMNTGDGVEVIDIAGPLIRSDYDDIGDTIDAALANAGTEAIVLRIDSPGGQVAGAFELADKIRAARDVKPIYAIADGAAHSAAYLIASQATSIHMTRTGSVGSIGVIVAHQEVSQMLEGMGVRVNLITSGARKADGNPFEPLSDEARASLQASVDEYARQFFDAVAAGRGISASDVRAMDAAVFVGRQAESSPLIDGTATMDEVVQLAALHTPGGPYMGTDPAPDAVPAPEAQTPTPDPDALVAEAVAGERARVASLEAAAAGRPDLPASLLATAKAEGWSVDQYKIAAFEVAPKDPAAAYAAAVAEDSPEPAPADEVADGETAPADGGEPQSLEEKAAADFKNDPRIRADFKQESTYLAFLRAEAEGRVRHLTKDQS